MSYRYADRMSAVFQSHRTPRLTHTHAIREQVSVATVQLPVGLSRRDVWQLALTQTHPCSYWGRVGAICAALLRQWEHTAVILSVSTPRASSHARRLWARRHVRTPAGKWRGPARCRLRPPLPPIHRPSAAIYESHRHRAEKKEHEYTNEKECMGNDKGYNMCPVDEQRGTPQTRSASSWYARQAERSVIDFDMIRRLCQDTHMREHQRCMAVVLGCITAVKVDGNCKSTVVDTLLLLPIAERATAVATLFTHYALRQKKVDILIDAVLSDPCVTHEETWILLQGIKTVMFSSSSSDSNSIDWINVCWVEEIVRRVVSTAESLYRIVAALQLGESLLSLHTLAHLCREAGLWYESTAYSSAAVQGVIEVNPPPQLPTLLNSNGKNSYEKIMHGRCGFGDHIASLLQKLREDGSDTNAVIHAIEALQREMSPLISTYTMHRVAIILTRIEWEQTCEERNLSSSSSSSCSNNNNNNHTPTALQYIQLAKSIKDDTVLWREALKMHVEMRLGAASTARVLLPLHSSNWDATARVMRYTHEAGVLTAMEALRTVMELFPSGCYYVLVQLHSASANGGVNTSRRNRNRRCSLLFEAKPTPIVVNDNEIIGPEQLSSSSFPYWSSLLEWCVPEFATQEQGEKVKVGEWALWMLPVSCISRMASTIPQLTSSLITYWIRSLLHYRRYDSIDVLLHIASDRGVVPEMIAFVELLESVNHGSSSNIVQLQRFIRILQLLFPACAPAVFRAFVERAATLTTNTSIMKAAPSQSWDAALGLLSTVSVLGLVHYPRSCMESIAVCAPTPVVFSMLQLLGEMGKNVLSSPHRATPAPLERTALQRILLSTQAAGIHTSVDIFCSSASSISSARKKTTWWSSKTESTAIPIATALYKRQAVGLWYLALQDVAHWTAATSSGENHEEKRRRRNVEVHHAIRLAAFGTDSVGRLLHSIITSQEQYGAEEVIQGVSRGERRRRQKNDAMLVTTLACVAGVLVSQGQWESALRVTPLTAAALDNTHTVGDIPPLLQLVRLKALQCSSDFEAHATMLLQSQSSMRSRRGSFCGLGRIPMGLRRIIKKMQMEEAFCWW